ncbi:MAG TPA: triphosphoribosyl-dephospho-CoA synthase MdcB [Rhodocyclaceae bacterium]|nr:triphosphoribosyl-dephospho-CoA synthase MdcB [Rhodocyclaceae bacterium]
MPDRLLRLPLAPAAPAAHQGVAASAIGRLAVRSLYREVALAPKPGLVSPVDSGSHGDMDFRTFLRSLSALRFYFPSIAAWGAGEPEFSELQRLGIAAEARMLAATGGINTHRGAIFNLGLLCAAAGALAAAGTPLSATGACRLVQERWGAGILAGLARPAAGPCSHGLVVARRYGSGGARQEAADGFPAAREIGLPAYRAALVAGASHDEAAVQALFALVAEVEDTNLLWRGGLDGLRYGQRAAADFLAAGGVENPDWRPRAEAVHREFVRRRLSPGGSADLLGVTLFLDALDNTPPCA